MTHTFPKAPPDCAHSPALSARYVHTNLIAAEWQALARFYGAVFGCVRVPPERDLAGPDKGED